MENNIKKIRKSKGIPQFKMAEDLGVSRSWICKVECGEENPSFELATRIADYLGVKYYELYFL